MARLAERWAAKRAEPATTCPAVPVPLPARSVPSPAPAPSSHMMRITASSPGRRPSIYDEVKLAVAPTSGRGNARGAGKGRRATVPPVRQFQSPLRPAIDPSDGAAMVPGLSFGLSPLSHTSSSSWIETPSTQMRQTPSPLPATWVTPDCAHPSMLGPLSGVAVKVRDALDNASSMPCGLLDLPFDSKDPAHGQEAAPIWQGQGQSSFDPLAAPSLQMAQWKLQYAPQVPQIAQPTKRKVADAELEEPVIYKRAATAFKEGRGLDEGGHSHKDCVPDENDSGEPGDERAATNGGAAGNLADDLDMLDFDFLFNEPVGDGTADAQPASSAVEGGGEASEPAAATIPEDLGAFCEWLESWGQTDGGE